MWAWIIRLVGGWLPIGTKPLGEWLGKILWVSGILAVGLIVYHKFTDPTSSTTQQAGAIYNDYYDPKPTFGCSTIKNYKYYPKNEIKKTE